MSKLQEKILKTVRLANARLGDDYDNLHPENYGWHVEIKYQRGWVPIGDMYHSKERAEKEMARMKAIDDRFPLRVAKQN